MKNQIPLKQKIMQMSPQERGAFHQKLKDRLSSCYNKVQMQKARKKAIAKYTTIDQDLQKQLWHSNNWNQVVNFHRKHHPLYKKDEINQFLRLYHQQAKLLEQNQQLMPNLKFMLEGYQIKQDF